MSEQILKQILLELSGINNEQQQTNKRLTNIETDLNTLKETTARLELKQNLIYEQTGKLSEYHTETKAEFKKINDRLAFQSHKITETELELFKLKRD